MERKTHGIIQNEITQNKCEKFVGSKIEKKCSN